ncbi:MAG: hypothetical protein ACFFCM_01440 [Promethearchaeota archaeon]
MNNSKNTILASTLVKDADQITLYKQAKQYLIHQIYLAIEYIYDNFGLDAMKDYINFNQNKYFDLKMSRIYKAFEGVIKKLPKSLKLKEALKMKIDQFQFIELPKNIAIIENNKERAIFEVIECSLRKGFNKLAKKSKKLELTDKCCLWCMSSFDYIKKNGLDYQIELTKKGCLNYLK